MHTEYNQATGKTSFNHLHSIGFSLFSQSDVSLGSQETLDVPSKGNRCQHERWFAGENSGKLNFYELELGGDES